MAGSKFAYVRNFELPDPLLPGTFMVFRLDGHSFHRFSEKHNFAKPNDLRALQLMDHAAQDLMEEYPDIVLAFGESDEFRQVQVIVESRLLCGASLELGSETVTPFTKMPEVLDTTEHWRDIANHPSSFQDPTSPWLICKDRVDFDLPFHVFLLLYPGEQQVRDYFAWRQADTHINNLYNTVFWALVQQGGETTTQAHATLRGTVSKDKHEILFTRFQVNYNQIDERFRKGSVLVREEITDSVDVSLPPSSQQGGHTAGDAMTEPPRTKIAQTKRGVKARTKAIVLHCDIIKDDFWNARPGILAG
ncbi:putative adds a GMP to the 5'-end of tRNA(His) after transcription and RNase P cleavage [Lyophyllum shimeji]|uniref:tRNA(His) guanylyltransferase n=1 Tax=Lyophyllum shimeji TaxID=47721 RepID=A0A9P3PXE4_LYOSH|nr:putative adds a GMP to the 5'-end of tRNA(His) after transcription and RNase P cleavage [Lyophyllum shimeji]